MSWRVRIAIVAALAVGTGLPPFLPAEPAARAATSPFNARLRIPPVYTAQNLTITMRAACVQILPGPCTRMWTYDGMFPGPTIRRPSGKTTRVTFVNRLPKEVGSTTVHHHGAHSKPMYDGQPDEYLIEPGKKFTYVWDFMERGEPERAATQWYHDHRMDVTGRNVWMGLAGMFLLDDAFDAKLPLPRGAFDVPLMVTDRTFDAKNQLIYKFRSIGTLGERILVNGVPTPYFDVADRTYRFRLLNASNYREYRFELSNGAEMTQIATESGLLPQPIRRKSIVLGPAERAEVIVDFKGMLGKSVVLRNTNPPTIDETSVPGEVMQFRVNRRAKETSRVPSTLRPVPDFGEPSVTRVWALQGAPVLGKTRREDEAEPPRNILWMINGQVYDHHRVDARPVLGATERWTFVNNTATHHRMHIHDVDWKVVSRTGAVAITSPGDPDAAVSETGLRETFLVQSGETVTVESKFTDHTGRYLFQCHISEHEDNAMMAQFEVMPPGSGPLGSG